MIQKNDFRTGSKGCGSQKAVKLRKSLIEYNQILDLVNEYIWWRMPEYSRTGSYRNRSRERVGERGVPGDRILCALLIRLISDGDMITVTTSASASTSGQFQNRYLPAFG